MLRNINNLSGMVLTAVMTAVLLLLWQNSIPAQTPMVKTQVPGYFRMMVGEYEVTALCDGSIELGSKILHNAPEEEINALLKQVFSNPEKIHTSVNAFLVNTGKKLVLIDAGTGKIYGPGLGSVIPNLIASGYRPEEVDAIFLTHLHGDHIGGLAEADGKAAFPNAVVYLSKEENDFWLSDNAAANAPERMKTGIQMAARIAAPYISAGKWKPLEKGQQPISGIKAISTKGHTGGHTSYEITSGSESLLVIGDLIHVKDVQLKKPEISIDFDSDQKQAVETRIDLFKDLSEKGEYIAGAHLPFPGIGRLGSDGAKGFIWVPVNY